MQFNSDSADLSRLIRTCVNATNVAVGSWFWLYM